MRILIILLRASIALRVIRGLFTRLEKILVGSSVSIERVKRADTITGMLRTMSVIFVTAVAMMMILRETGRSSGGSGESSTEG